MIPMLLLNLWVMNNVRAGMPPNMCVDACQVLRYALGQFGIRSAVAAVLLVVDDPVRGAAVCGTLEPSWDGTELDGHCILWLPGQQRFADPTVAQYPPAARLSTAPVLGKVASANGAPGDLADLAAGILPEGTRFGVRRGDGALLYTIASEQATQVITGDPWIMQNAGLRQAAGINLASQAITALRAPNVIQRAMTVPYPRVTALLGVIGDAPDDADDLGDWYFLLPAPNGGRKPVRLDQVPLPEGCPPELP
jgi:hypothetical protein